MIGKKCFKKVLVIGAICLLTLPSIQVALGDTPGSELNDSNEGNVSNTGGSTHYKNCRIIVFGKCDTVIGPLVWLFGFYCPLTKRDFLIKASGGENESLNVLIFGGGNFGTYYDYENIIIDLNKANGFLYWFGKSLLFKGNSIFTFCKAQDVWVTT